MERLKIQWLKLQIWIARQIALGFVEQGRMAKAQEWLAYADKQNAVLGELLAVRVRSVMASCLKGKVNRV